MKISRVPKLDFLFIGETERLNGKHRAVLPGQYIELPEGVVRYELAGPEDGPLVVLVHGFLGHYMIWDRTFQALAAAGMRVLRYDLYGRGYSDRPFVLYNLNLYIKQLHDFLDALGIVESVNDERVHLVGLSMGGIISANFTARFPEKVRSLTLIDPAGFRLPRFWVMKALALPFVGELTFGLFPSYGLLHRMANRYFSRESVEQLREQFILQMRYKGFRRSLLSTIRCGVLGNALPAYRKVGETGLPVQLFWGCDDAAVPFRFSRKLLSVIPQANLTTVDGAGHFPHLEKPEIVNPALIQFLRENDRQVYKDERVHDEQGCDEQVRKAV